MSIKKRIINLGFIGMLIIPLGIILVNPSHAFAANNDPEKDKERQILIAARDCFEKGGGVFSDGDPVTGDNWEERYRDATDDSSRSEKEVVGFDVDRDNGVASCYTLMTRGLIAADYSRFGIKADNTVHAQEIIVRILTNTAGPVNPGSPMPKPQDVNGDGARLANIMTAAIAKIDVPTNDLLAARVAPLVGACFYMTTSKPSDYNEGRGDFEVSGLGFFQQNRTMDRSDFDEFLDRGGLFAKIGDVELPWNNSSWVQDNGDGSSDFYPLGSEYDDSWHRRDYTFSPSNSHFSIIVDCHFVQKNRDKIFKDQSKWGTDGGNITFEGKHAVDGGRVGEEAEIEPELDCDANWSPLTWIICPVINLANEAIRNFDEFINQELTVDTNRYLNRGTTPGKGYFAVWSAIRYLAMSLLVVIALVMVIAQALQIEAFDAYTIRKVIPRMMIAIVFTAASWELLKYMIEFSNALGNGVRALIYRPFVGAGGLEAKIKVVGDNLLAANIIGGVALAGLGMMGLLSFAGVALLAVLTAAVVLIFRKILILLLLMLAPLAIIMFILPGTQRIWKLWWENWIKLLLMFAIISAFIAAGRVFAATASAGGGDGFANSLVTFIAYYGPYFLLPATVRLAGGAMAAMGNLANQGRSRLTPTIGLGNFRQRRMKVKSEKRAEKRKELGQRAMGDNLIYNPNKGKRREWLNKKIGTGAFIAAGAGGYNVSKWKSRIADQKVVNEVHHAEEALEKDENIKALAPWDDGFRAILDSKDMEELRNTSKQYFEEYDSNGDVIEGSYDKKNHEQWLSRAEKAKKQYSPEVLDLIAWRQAMAGGTSFDTTKDYKKALDKIEAAKAAGRVDDQGNALDEDGTILKEHDGMDWVRGMLQATRGNVYKRDWATKVAKEVGVAAGRPDYNYSFGTAKGIFNRLARVNGGASEAEQKANYEEMGDLLYRNVAESTPASMLANPGIKMHGLMPLIPQWRKRLDRAHRGVTLQEDDNGVEREVAAASNEEAELLRDVEAAFVLNMQDVVAHNKSEGGRLIGDALLSYVPGAPVQLNAQEIGRIGKPNQAPPAPVLGPAAAPTVLDDAKTRRTHRTTQLYRREYVGEGRDTTGMTPEQIAAHNAEMERMAEEMSNKSMT